MTFVQYGCILTMDIHINKKGGVVLKKNLGNKRILGNNLRYLMDQKGVTAKDLSKEMNYPYTTVLSWLKGEYYPRIDKVEELSDYFEVSMDALILEQMKEPAETGELSQKQSEFIEKIKLMSDEELERLDQILRLVENTK